MFLCVKGMYGWDWRPRDGCRGQPEEAMEMEWEGASCPRSSSVSHHLFHLSSLYIQHLVTAGHDAPLRTITPRVSLQRGIKLPWGMFQSPVFIEVCLNIVSCFGYSFQNDYCYGQTCGVVFWVQSSPLEMSSFLLWKPENALTINNNNKCLCLIFTLS